MRLLMEKWQKYMKEEEEEEEEEPPSPQKIKDLVNKFGVTKEDLERAHEMLAKLQGEGKSPEEIAESAISTLKKLAQGSTSASMQEGRWNPFDRHGDVEELFGQEDADILDYEKSMARKRKLMKIMPILAGLALVASVTVGGGYVIKAMNEMHQIRIANEVYEKERKAELQRYKSFYNNEKSIKSPEDLPAEGWEMAPAGQSGQYAYIPAKSLPDDFLLPATQMTVADFRAKISGTDPMPREQFYSESREGAGSGYFMDTAKRHRGGMAPTGCKEKKDPETGEETRVCTGPSYDLRELEQLETYIHGDIGQHGYKTQGRYGSGLASHPDLRAQMLPLEWSIAYDIYETTIKRVMTGMINGTPEQRLAITSENGFDNLKEFQIALTQKYQDATGESQSEVIDMMIDAMAAADDNRDAKINK